MEIRPFRDPDTEAIVELSLRAWAPVFASLERVLGPEVFRRQHPDWREDQRRVVEEVLREKGERVWVAEVGGSVAGFVSIEPHHPERDMGEISILAVDPDRQGAGVGSALTEFALDRLREAGVRVATVETGGDAGHAPARRTYEKSGFVVLPVARYFKNL